MLSKKLSVIGQNPLETLGGGQFTKNKVSSIKNSPYVRAYKI